MKKLDKILDLVMRFVMAVAMFALLALGGDIGCSAGPTLVGLVSGAMDDDLKLGILAGVLFPLLLVAGIALAKKPEVKRSNEGEAVLGEA